MSFYNQTKMDPFSMSKKIRIEENDTQENSVWVVGCSDVYIFDPHVKKKIFRFVLFYFYFYFILILFLFLFYFYFYFNFILIYYFISFNLFFRHFKKKKNGRVTKHLLIVF